jgi:hypothetical protein
MQQLWATHRNTPLQHVATQRTALQHNHAELHDLCEPRHAIPGMRRLE